MEQAYCRGMLQQEGMLIKHTYAFADAGYIAGAFNFDFEEQELDERLVRGKVLEEMQFYNSSRAWRKACPR